jgi:integrase
MTRNDVVFFLNKLRKRDEEDPMHKWKGTYNNYKITLTRFFKWLYYPNILPTMRSKPQVVQNIANQTRREISIYLPSDLWSEADDRLFLTYCPSKRINCYHVVSRDTSARPHEILGLTIGNIQYKSRGHYQYAEVVVNGKTGSRSLGFINSIAYVKDYLDHSHPCPNDQSAAFIAHKTNGKHILRSTLANLYQDLKNEYFPALLLKKNVPDEDKQKIRELLRKPWNPYVRRHTAITEKAKNHKILPMLESHCGWVEGSKMKKKYVHYFGNESNEVILEAYGILDEKETNKQEPSLLKPKTCPNCNESTNKPDAKFCIKCRAILTYDSYVETMEKERQRDMDVKQLTDQVKELSEDYEMLVQMYEHDPQERNKLKLLYAEAQRNGTRKLGQILYLKKSEYTPNSFAYHAYGDMSGD